MNDWKPLENQLRSWTPRAPSPSLKERLFPHPAEASELSAAALSGRWRWLAPALLCLMLVSVTFNTRNGHISYGTAGTNNLLDILLRTQAGSDCAAYLEAGFHSDRNGLRKETFEWTNGHSFISSIRSLSLAKTNTLLH